MFNLKFAYTLGRVISFIRNSCKSVWPRSISRRPNSTDPDRSHPHLLANIANSIPDGHLTARLKIQTRYSSKTIQNHAPMQSWIWCIFYFFLKASKATIADVIPSIMLMKEAFDELQDQVTTNGKMLIRSLIEEVETRFGIELKSPLFMASCQY